MMQLGVLKKLIWPTYIKHSHIPPMLVTVFYVYAHNAANLIYNVP